MWTNLTCFPDDASKTARVVRDAVRVECETVPREPEEPVARNDEQAVHPNHCDHVAERDAHVEVAVVRRDLEGAPPERAQDESVSHERHGQQHGAQVRVRDHEVPSRIVAPGEVGNCWRRFFWEVKLLCLVRGHPKELTREAERRTRVRKSELSGIELRDARRRRFNSRTL